MWTQVQAVRQAMHNDMTQLATIARQQAAQAAEAETRLTKSIRWGVRVLQRCEDSNAMRVVFSNWRCACPAIKMALPMKLNHIGVAYDDFMQRIHIDQRTSTDNLTKAGMCHMDVHASGNCCSYRAYNVQSACI